MEINKLPKANTDRSETGCCPRFNPAPWGNKQVIFEDKPFVKAKTINFLRIPLNMGSVITKTWKKIEEAGADSKWNRERFPATLLSQTFQMC